MKTKTLYILPKGPRGGRGKVFTLTQTFRKSRQSTRDILKLLGVVVLMVVVLLVFDIKW